MHWGAITLAMDSHCGDKCIHCTGNGKMWWPETDQNGPCPYCHGFGKRELRPAPPRYMFTAGVIDPRSILNWGSIA